MGGDKNPGGEFVYVGDSFGGNLARINIKTNKVDLIPLPDPQSQQPYQVTIDKDHNVWTNLWSTDAIAKYNPATSQWTLFDLPSRGTETRHISLLEKDGKMQIVLPYSRTRRVAVMTVRSEDEMKQAAQRAAR
jgi:streptogramin lyase